MAFIEATTAAVVLAAVSAATAAYSSYAQGKAQSNMAAYNALVASQNAALALEQMDVAKTQKDIMAARLRKGADKTLAAQRAGWAKAGVEMAGTPLMVAVDTEYETELDVLAIQYSSTVEQGQLLAQAAGLKQEATLQRMAGGAAREAGRYGVGVSLLSGAANITNRLSIPKVAAAPTVAAEPTK